MSPTSSILLALPDELLLQLSLHLHDIEDLKNVSSTCTRLHSVFTDVRPKTILRLAAQAAPTFFSPHPHFLVLAVARQIAAWAVAIDAERHNRVQQLVEAFRGGMHGVLSLALRDDVEGVGLTMDDVRRMYELRFRVINPLSATIDAMIGDAWYAQPNFWNGGADDAFTLQADASEATFQFLIYGALFGSTMDSYLQPRGERKFGLDADTRIEFIKYCIPDYVCWSRDDGFDLLPIGPYETDTIRHQQNGNQTGLAHLVGGSRFRGTLWKRAWRRVLIAAGAEANEDGKWPEDWIRRLQKTRFRKVKRPVGDSADDAAGYVQDQEQAQEGGEDGESDDYDESDSDSESDPKDWRFTLFWDSLTILGGPETVAMVAQFKGREENRDAIMKPEWKAHILQLRNQVLGLADEDKPGFKKYGKGRRQHLEVSEAPDFGAELYWCMAGMWGGF